MLTHYCIGLLIDRSGLLILTRACSVFYSASSFAFKSSVFIRKKGITLDTAIHQSESAFLIDVRARGQPIHTTRESNTSSSQEQTQQCRIITTYLLQPFQISYGRLISTPQYSRHNQKHQFISHASPFQNTFFPLLFQPSYLCAMRTTTPSDLFKHQPKNPSIYYYLYAPSKTFCHKSLASFFMDCTKTYQMGLLQQGFWQCEVPSA